MSLKNVLKNQRAQAVVEYMVMFLLFTAGAIIIFLASNKGGPESLKITSVFNQVIDSAIEKLN